MFFAFIPLLVALGGVASLLAMPTGAGAHGGWELALLFAVLPLWGGIIGNLPERWWGGALIFASGSRGIIRRVVHMGGWYLILAMTGLPSLILSRLEALGGVELVMAIFLVNFWVSDALSQHPFPTRHWNQRGARSGSGAGGRAAYSRQWYPEGLSAQAPLLRDTLRQSMPMVVLIVVGLGWTVLMQLGWLPRLTQLSGGWLPPAAVSVLGLLFVAGVGVPLLIRFCWGLQPLRGPETMALIREELAANGVTVARICAWPDGLMGFATAGVIGLLPPFRYLLVSPALAAMLTPNELRSVVAHEAAHIKQRHLWYFAGAIAGFVLLLQALLMLLAWAGLVSGMSLPPWAHLAGYFAALLLFLRYGIGFVSRIFERQADGNALRRLGPDAFAQAITKLAAYNDMPLEQDNWHHYGIAQRIRHARAAGFAGGGLDRHDRVARRLKMALIALFLLGMLAEVTLSSGAVAGFLDRTALGSGEMLTKGHLPPLLRLAHGAFNRKAHLEAERYFRMILKISPDDPSTRNNLAWVLVTRPGAERAVLEEGLALAKSAAAQREQAYILDTLAESYSRLGQHDKALETARKALALNEAGSEQGGAPREYYRAQLKKFSRGGGGWGKNNGEGKDDEGDKGSSEGKSSTR